MECVNQRSSAKMVKLAKSGVDLYPGWFKSGGAEQKQALSPVPPV